MKILVACECYGVVRDAFLRSGHDAWSCDLKDTRVPGPHIKGDVLDHLNEGWDLMIGHPVCRYLCNSGVRWLEEELGRPEKMKEAVDFFNKLLNADIEMICLENPIPHKYGLGNTYTQLVQPFNFGHQETKAICIWLKNLPILIDTMTRVIRNGRVHQMPSGPMREELRAVFFPGIAWAMADQWGNL